MPDVFISYNREDQHRARGIADALESEGLDVWWDSNLKAGESYDEVTEKNLREAGAVVVLWSKQSTASKWVRAEATIGERCSTLVPAMIEDCERPLRFELVQTADLIRWHGDRTDPQWQSFIHAIKRAIGHHENTATPNQVSSATAPSASNMANDITIENTFWTSIKDGTDRSDFEAYLKRYPDGHFADLARNRVAALERVQKDVLEKSASKTAASAPLVARAPHSPQPTPAPTQQHSTPRHTPPAPVHEKKTNVVLYGLIGLGALAAAVTAFLTLQSRDSDIPASGNVASAVVKEEVSETDVTDSDTSSNTEVATAQNVPASAASVVDKPSTPLEAETLAVDEEGLSGEAKITAPEADKGLSSEGEKTFSDCETCPTMMTLAGGSFMMGSPDTETGRFAYEGPQREVTLKPFAIGVHEVTFDQWSACLEDSGCREHEPGDAGFGRGARPALYISWHDAKAYAGWLSKKSGRRYRLPTEAEWEYAARGGHDTVYWWGDAYDASLVARGKTKEVDSLPANPFGLHGMLSNVSEWVEDCYVNNYAQAPIDGSSVLSGDCGRRVVRGGAWRSTAGQMRAANRKRIGVNTRDRTLGFRIAADLKQ